MSKILSIDNEPVIVPIHFGNDTKHEISEKSLFVLLSTYKETLRELGVNVEINLSVPSEGGWKSDLIISIFGGVVLDSVLITITGYSFVELLKNGRKKVIDVVTRFLTKPIDELPKHIPSNYLILKNRLYQQFQSDDCIEYIEIDQSKKILRHDFNRYIAEVEDDKEDDKFIYIGEKNIIVSSPDWRNKRSWKGTVDNDEVSFKFDLDLTGKFWEKIKLDQLDTHTGTDNMLVQLAMCENVRPKYMVIRVMKYNDMDIDSQLMIEDLNKILLLPDEEQDLFSEIEQ